MITIFGGRFTSKSDELNTGNVVTMNRFRNGRGLSPIRQAEAYWSALRDGGSVPKRSDIDPRGLTDILDHTFILERIAPGIARFRLAGQHITQLAGMEVRGMPLTAFFTAGSRNEACAMLEHLFDAPAVIETALTSERKMGRRQLDLRMVLLPLQSDFGDVSRALGVIVADGTPSRSPYRFDIAQLTHRRLVTTPAEAPARPTEPAGMAEDPAPFDGPAPHLRLVVSRDT